MAGYGSDAAFATWLAANGFALPEGAAAPAVLREQGSTFIDGQFGSRFSGVPTGGYAQERAWPRMDAYAYGVEIPSDAIPTAVENASYAAAYQSALSPGSLSVVASGVGNIKREKVDVIETEYFAGSSDPLADATPRMLMVEGFLAPFLIPASRPVAFVV